MNVDEVIYIYIISHSCTIERIVVISIDRHFFSYTQSYLQDIGKKIIGYALR